MAIKKPVTTSDVKESEPAEEGYTRLVSPSGAVSLVPDSIVSPLIESGYKKSK